MACKNRQIMVKMDAPELSGLTDWFNRQNIYIKHPPGTGEGFNKVQAESITRDVHEILMFLMYQRGSAPPVYPPAPYGYQPQPQNYYEPPSAPPAALLPPQGPPRRPLPYAPGQVPPQNAAQVSAPNDVPVPPPSFRIPATF